MTEYIAPSLQDAPKPTPGLTKREPVFAAGSVAAVVTALAVCLKLVGIDLSNEVIDTIVELIVTVAPVVAPLVAAWVARGKVSPIE